jgi:NADH-quinone oxidoreductase subunit M
VYPDLLYKPIIGYVQNLYDETPDELIPIKIQPDSTDEQVQTNTTTTTTTTATATTNNAVVVASIGEEKLGQINNVTINLGTEMAQKTHLISGNHLVSYVTI